MARKRHAATACLFAWWRPRIGGCPREGDGHVSRADGDTGWCRVRGGTRRRIENRWAGDYIGRARIEKPGNVPVRFEIPYDTSRIVQNHQCGAGSHSSGVRRPLHSRPSAPTTPLSGTSTTAANGCMRANRACPN